MQVENEFTAALAGLFGPEAVRPNAAGEYVFRFAGTPLKMVCRPDAPEEVCCYAKIGTIEGIERVDGLLADFLEANFFWLGNAGSTVAVVPGSDDVILEDRREAAYFESAETLKGYLAAFVDKVLTWRGHIDEYRKAVAETGAEAGKEVRQ